MSLYSLKIVIATIFWISIAAYSQQKQTYTSFGVIPNHVDKELYVSLKNTDDPLQKIMIMDTIANKHILYGNTDSIVHYGSRLNEMVLKNQQHIDNKNYYISKSYYISGKGKLKNGLLEDALKYHIDGIAISPEKNMNTLHYKHQLGLANIYFHKKEFDSALPILEKCIQKASSKELKANAKKLIADIDLYQGNFDKATSAYNDVLKDLDTNKSEDLKKSLVIQLNLGRIESRKENYDNALTLLDNIKQQALDNKFYDVYINSVLQIGTIDYRLKNYETAELILNTAYVNTVQWNRLELQKVVIRALTRLYSYQEDYKNAYNLMTHYTRVSDEINAKQNKEAVRELEIKYQTLQKEKEILSLKKDQLIKESEIKRQRTIKIAVLIGFLIVLLPVIGLLVLYFQKLKTQIALNKSQEEVNTQKIYGLMKDQELNLIKATMKGQDEERQRLAQELHDSVGGNLASIKLQLSNTDNIDDHHANIIKQIDETYNNVRDFSHNLVPKKFQKNTITTLIKEYVQNIKNGISQNISFHPFPKNEVNQINTSLTEELFKIIQELLTNCIKHSRAKNIDIYLNHYDDSIQLIFEDNGVGFETNKAKDGIGFRNIKNRLEKLSGTLFIDSVLNRGTIINIEIPS